MNWLQTFAASHPVAHALLILSGVAATGLAFGSVKVRGIGLGIAGALFSGIVFGHFGLTIDHGILEFVRDFGLVLFVYTIGMQVGPGFLTSLRRHGLPLNLLAAGIVTLGAGLTLAIAWLGNIDVAAAVGLFSGGTTNTPALGAAQEALKSLPGLAPGRLALPGLGYAVAYPFGIVGIILTMLLLRAVFRVNVEDEAAALAGGSREEASTPERMNVEVENGNLDGLTVAQIPGAAKLGIVISRIKPRGEDEVRGAQPGTVLHRGDVLLAVGLRESLEQFRLIVGRPAELDLREMPGRVRFGRVIVTQGGVLGKSLRELALDRRFGVVVTRVARADIEITAGPDLRLQFGDRLHIVGDEAALTQAAEALGNSLKALNHTNFIPVFVGIALGILVGSYPVPLPGVPMPVMLGVAGGPLLVAIILSQVGRIGPLVWYMPINANIALRELGITLFLACVGLKAGGHFVEILLNGSGFYWMACAALITLVPLITFGLIGRAFLKLNFMNLCGLLAGSMTDPPALAFANTIARSDAPSVAYATVYPLTMILRILLAQLIVLLFVR